MANESLVHPNLKYLRDQFQRLFSTWLTIRNNLKTEPSTYGVVNTTLRDFDDTFVSLNNFLGSDAAEVFFNPIVANIYVRNKQWENSFNQIINLLNNLQANPAQWPVIFDHFFSFILTLSGCFFGGPNFTPDKKVNSVLRQKVSQANETFKEAGELLTNAKSSIEKSKMLEEQISQQVFSANELNGKLENALKNLEAYKAGLNQKGLAGSFSDRASKLKWPLIGWMISFVLSILIISSVSLVPFLINLYHHGSLFYPNSIVVTNEKNPENKNSEVIKDFKTIHQENLQDLALSLLVRILMSSPVIWFAWFSAKHYGINKRLKEEYEFKAVSASAYYGYSQEADAHPDLKKDLLQGAIKNFNENPSNTISMSKDRISPLEEVILETLKKVDPTIINKILDTIASLKGK